MIGKCRGCAHSAPKGRYGFVCADCAEDGFMRPFDGSVTPGWWTIKHVTLRRFDAVEIVEGMPRKPWQRHIEDILHEIRCGISVPYGVCILAGHPRQEKVAFADTYSEMRQQPREDHDARQWGMA